MSGGREQCSEIGIGIDLGTTYSCVAVWQNGRVQIIPNDMGNRTTPSYVSFTDYERLIGETAVNQATKNHLNTIFDAKRLIGRRFSDHNLQQDTKLWPFMVVDGIDSGKPDQPMILVNYMGKQKKFTPEEISAMTIAKMKGVAEALLGRPVNNAVITVPASFNNLQRRATKDAGKIAGFNAIRIINEPTAAAMAYGLDMNINGRNDAKKNVLVFDLGGGTFDVSLVAMEKGQIRVKAVSGDTHLGGADFDNKMMLEFVEEFKEQHKKDISKNVKALVRLRVASERAKRVLSLLPQVDVDIDCLFEGIDFNTTITRARFEELNMDLFKKCINTVDQCLNDAVMEKTDVHDIILVGGSSRIPKVQQMLREFFDGKELCKSIQPDEAVAYGAAIHAATKDIDLADVTPLSLGVELLDSKMGFIIRRNTIIPTEEPKTYNLQDNLTDVFRFGVYEGEKTNFKENNFLGVCEFSGFSLAPKGTRIDVKFDVDENGILEASAEMKVTGWGIQRTIMNHHGRLSKEEIERMIKETENYKAQDEKRRKLMQAKSDLESYANTILDRLNDARNINNVKEEKIKEGVDMALRWLEVNSKLPEISKFEEKLKDLKRICGDFES